MNHATRLLAHFGSKEELQLAAVEAASHTFVEAVVVPALGKPAGLARLWALVDGFLVYVERRVFPGGCFMGATFAECDSHPGPLRDALVGVRAQWLAVLEHAITTAKRAGDLSRNPTAADLAFEIDALLADGRLDGRIVVEHGIDALHIGKKGNLTVRRR